ncbi:glycosyltransferase 52 family protein, partial [Vibrio parahaemolyticus]
KNLPIEQEIYFDDGTLTLAEYPKFIFPKAEFFRPRWFQDFVVRLNGCKPIGRLKQSQNLEVFTMFNL